MSISSQDEKRDIIPRWRSFNKTIQLGELTQLNREKSRSANNDLVFNKHRAAWDKNKSIPFATEFLSAAFIMGRSKEVIDVAQVVIEADIPEAAKTIARRVLGGKAEVRDFSVRDQELRAWIKIHRQYIEFFPRDPFVWVDLALGYSSVGEKKKAERSILTALQLAPSDRFVLRSAARFFIHVDQHRVANDLIRRAPSLLYDPWLIAAEIATSQACGRGPKTAKLAKGMLSQRAHLPYDLSELASALGMLEYRENKLKKAKKAFQDSLVNPTENSIAQAHWAVRHEDGFDLDHGLLKPSGSVEALAFQSYKDGDWDDALFYSSGWRDDQPFSTRPISLASYIAALIEKDELAETLAMDGLKTNPENSILLNNLAISLARQGKLAESRYYLARLPVPDNDRDRIIHTATKGLINYREGRILQGAEEYAKAYKMAKNIGNNELLLKGLIYEKRERINAGIAVAPNEVKALEEAVNKLKLHDIDTLYSSLKKAAGIK